MAVLIDVVTLSKKLCKTPIRCELKYATDDNFVGRVIDGYDEKVTDVGFLTEKAATYLCDVQNYLYDQYNYSLLIYDAYRPHRAVIDFMRWIKQPPADQHELDQKIKHYPHLEKSQLFEMGYLSEDSRHCYGNTVDLVLIDAINGKPLDMGACFDFMDERSHIAATAEKIGREAFQHRQVLLQAMQEFDFEPYYKEFWHFSHPLATEAKTPINIPLKPGLTKIEC